MLRLLKYLKPYLLLIVLAIALLFVQANADLALPDYLARIVNTGIQLSGIDSAVPLATRQSTMDSLTLFLSAHDKASVLADYTLVDKSSANYDQLVKQYPDLANEPIFVRNQISQAEVDKLNPIMGKAIMVFSFIKLSIDNPTQAATLTQSFGFDLSKISSGQAGSGTLSQAQALQLITPVLKSEYTSLGMDPAAIATILAKDIPIPVAIRQSSMDKLTLSMSPQDKASVLSNYILVDKTSPSYDQYVKQYPALLNESVYVLGQIDPTTLATLAPIMAKVMIFASQAQAITPAISAEYTALGMDPAAITTTLSKGLLIPVAIRQISMDRLTLFMSAQDKATVLGNYTLVDKTSADYTQFAQQYPALANEPVYLLKQADPALVATLTPLMARSFITVSLFQEILNNPSQASATLQNTGFDLSKLSSATSSSTGLSASMINQAAAGSIKTEYTALGMDVNKFELNYLTRIGATMMGLVLLSGVCTISVSLLAARTAAGMGRDVRKAQFIKVESFSSTEFDKFSTTSLINRSTNDITQVQLVVFMIIRMVLYAPIIGIGAIIHAFRLDTSMWWIIAVAVGVLLTIILIVFSVALPRFRIIQSLIDRLALVLRENLSGMMVIRAFNRQDFELERFEKANLDLTSTMLFINRVMIVMMPLMMLIMNAITISIIWIGAHQIADANLQIGDMLAFMQYAMQVVFAFLMLSMMFIFLPRAFVAGNRVADVLEAEPVIKDPAEPKQFSDAFKGTVEFRNVSFHYPDAEEDVLHDINFIARPGQTTALIGSTGSGKSTVVNLIPRFYDVTAGSILVDGIDIRQVTQHDLRDKIGYIPQKGVLFSGTIASNLRYADENATDEVLMEATDIAQATEFILGDGNGSVNGNGTHNTQNASNVATNMDGNGYHNGNGFEKEIAQGGMNVSGGQKQRLSIARALVKKPPIYIFDDSFSAVDFKTDAALRRALKQKTSGSTILIVTQRVSTIKNAEQIIVLDEGRIIGKGSHQELMKDCKAYQEIALSQLSQEELL